LSRSVGLRVGRRDQARGELREIIVRRGSRSLPTAADLTDLRCELDCRERNDERERDRCEPAEHQPHERIKACCPCNASNIRVTASLCDLDTSGRSSY